MCSLRVDGIQGDQGGPAILHRSAPLPRLVIRNGGPHSICSRSGTAGQARPRRSGAGWGTQPPTGTRVGNSEGATRWSARAKGGRPLAADHCRTTLNTLPTHQISSQTDHSLGHLRRAQETRAIKRRQPRLAEATNKQTNNDNTNPR